MRLLCQSGELHAMAARLGVARRWSRSPAHTAGSHCDTSASKRALAIATGAIPVTLRRAAAMNARRRITGELDRREDGLAWLHGSCRWSRSPGPPCPSCRARGSTAGHGEGALPLTPVRWPRAAGSACCGPRDNVLGAPQPEPAQGLFESVAGSHELDDRIEVLIVEGCRPVVDALHGVDERLRVAFTREHAQRIEVFPTPERRHDDAARPDCRKLCV